MKFKCPAVAGKMLYAGGGAALKHRKIANGDFSGNPPILVAATTFCDGDGGLNFFVLVS
jgi:hypothetical protein